MYTKYDICDEEIVEGSTCYKIGGVVYWPECMKIHFKIVAESVDVDSYLLDLEHEDITK